MQCSKTFESKTAKAFFDCVLRSQNINLFPTNFVGPLADKDAVHKNCKKCSSTTVVDHVQHV